MNNIEKTAENDTSTLGALATGGTYGAALAALLGLYRMYRDDKEEIERQHDIEDDNISDDTIVLRVPKKKPVAEQKFASARDDFADFHDSGSSDIPYSEEGMTRDEKGRFVEHWDSQKTETDKNCGSCGEKKAVLAEAGRDLAIIGGGVAGYAIMDRIINHIRIKKLKGEIEAAQIADLEDDTTPEKYAEVVAPYFIKKSYATVPFQGVSDAVSHPMQSMNEFGGGATAAVALSVLMTAYITKKVMDQQFGTKHLPEDPETKVNRIVLKSGEARIPMEPDTALALIGLMKESIKNASVNEKSAGFPFDPLGLLSNPEEVIQNKLEEYIKALEQGNQGNANPEALKKALNNPAIAQRVINVLGNGDNKALRERIISANFNNRWNNSENWGWIRRIPVLGDLLGKLIPSLFTNTQYGNKMLVNGLYDAAGINEEDRKNNAAYNGIKYNANGGFATSIDNTPKPAQAPAPTSAPAPAPAPTQIGKDDPTRKPGQIPNVQVAYDPATGTIKKSSFGGLASSLVGVDILQDLGDTNNTDDLEDRLSALESKVSPAKKKPKIKIVVGDDVDGRTIRNKHKRIAQILERLEEQGKL